MRIKCGVMIVGALMWGFPHVAASDVKKQDVGKQNVYDVIVVGAGTAGLAAAKRLHEDGSRVLVLERDSRIGGRILPDYTPDGTPIDLGAATLHGVEDNPITMIMKKQGYSHLFKRPEMPLSSREERLLDQYAAENDRLRERYEELTEDLFAFAEEKAEQVDYSYSVQDTVDAFIRERNLQRDDEAKRIIENFVYADIELDSAVEASQISLLDIVEEEQDEDAFLTGNYYQVIKYLSQPIKNNIRMNTGVTTIAYGGDTVAVSTDSGEVLYAKHVIVTVPLGVLKNNDITFTPALPQRKQKAIQELNMGVLDKVILKFPVRFWQDISTNLSFLRNEPGKLRGFADYTIEYGEPILIGYVSGETAKRIEQKSDQAVIDDAIQLLKSAYSQEIEQARKEHGYDVLKPTYTKVTRWWQNPLSRGAYSHAPVGTKPKNHEILGEPVNGKVFFAGEATHTSEEGTVHGAYETGRRDALRVIEQQSREK